MRLTRRGIFGGCALPFVTVPAISATRPTTIEGMLSELERRFVVHPEVGDYSRAPTGEEYIVIRPGGLTKEGQISPLLASSEEGAIRSWIDAVYDYAANKSGTVYWREMPETDWREFSRTEFMVDHDYPAIRYWTVYCRFLISDKPQIQPARFWS